jgi:integrase/recombinase XerD
MEEQHTQTIIQNSSQNLLKVVKSRKAKKLPVAISDEEFFKLIEHTNMKEHKLAFLLGFGAGMRLSEVLSLQPSEVNFSQKSILIKEGKGKKDRVVPMPKGFKEEYLKMLPLKFGPRALQITFKRTAKRAGLLVNKPTLHFHSLRHGFATNSVSKGIPIHHIRTLMGHSNISTTNVYLEMNPKDALKSYEELF